MTARIAVLVVHGMGSQTVDSFRRSADRMIAGINQELSNAGFDGARLVWERAFWGDVLQVHETELLRTLGPANLNWMWLRRFVINNLGDAVAYQHMPSVPKDFYFEIHERLHAALCRLRRSAGNADAPLVIMAHSLGGYMLSNYIWDRQHGYDAAAYGSTPFERMETLASIITFGCNIAVLGLALKPYVGLEFPPQQLPAELAAAARWINFYSRNDVLGYPIKPLCADYTENEKVRDEAIRVGNLLTAWNPMSHDAYWGDANFIQPAARQFKNLLAACEGPSRTLFAETNATPRSADF